MTQKLNLAHFENLALKRNHRLLEITNEDCIRKGNLKLHCHTCNTSFETSAASYKNARKTGCSPCKRINASRGSKQPKNIIDTNLVVCKAKPTVKTINKVNFSHDKAIAIRIERAKKYAHIKCLDDLISDLKKNSNIYNDYILQHLLSLPPVAKPLKGSVLERHHIIPRHAGGSDHAWNLITLTAEDHYSAHFLRKEAFGETGDRLACRFRSSSNLTAQQQKDLRRQASHETSRQKKVGFFNAEQQSINGIKGGTVQTPSKITMHRKKMGPRILEHLSTKVIWQHNILKETITIEPYSCTLLTQLIPLFIKIMSQSDQAELVSSDLERLKTQPKGHITSFIAKVIKKKSKSCYGWFIVESLSHAEQHKIVESYNSLKKLLKLAIERERIERIEISAESKPSGFKDGTFTEALYLILKSEESYLSGYLNL